MAGISISNWLGQRSGAGAITMLGVTPFDPDTDALPTAWDENNYIPANHEVVENSRHYFRDHPEGYVYKKKGADAVGNYLLLKLSTSWKYGNADIPVVSSYPWMSWGLYSIGGGGNGIFHYLSSHWAGGDNKHYLNWTVYGNQAVPDTDPQEYDVYTTSYSYSPQTGATVDSFTDIQRSFSKVGTTANAYIGPVPAGDEGEYYAEFTNVLNYDEDQMIYNNGTKTVYIALRDESASPHDLSPYVLTSPGIGADNNLQTYGPVVSPTNLLGLYDQSHYTYQGVTSWVPTGSFAKQTVQCKFIYRGAICPECWYEGAKVTVKVKYKVATVTRGDLVELPGGESEAFSNSVGTFSAHSEVEKVLILPGKGATAGTEQDVEIEGGSMTFDVPVEAGKVICVDDVVITAIEPPGSTP